MKRLTITAAATATIFAICAAPTMAAPASGPGSLDPTFGKGGIALSSFSDAKYDLTTAGTQAILPDGKTVVGGEHWVGPQYSPTLTRLLPDGSVDKSFGVDGKVTTKLGKTSGNVSDVVVLPSGKLLAVVSHNRGNPQEPKLRVVTIRYTADGKLDKTYGAHGIAALAVPGHAASAASASVVGNKVVIGMTALTPTTSEIAVARINANGGFDQSYGVNGVAEIPLAQNSIASDVSVANDGTVAVAGTQLRGSGEDDTLEAVVAKLDASGHLNKSFGRSGTVTKAIGFSNTASGIAVDKKGRIVTSGYAQSETDGVASFAVMRMNSDGSFDKSFCESGFATYRLSDSDDVGGKVAVDDQGRIVVGGTQWSEVPESMLKLTRPKPPTREESNQLDRTGFEVLRLTEDGARDVTFGERGAVVTPIQAGAQAYGLVVTSERIQLVGFSFTHDLRYSVAVARYLA